MEIKTGYRIGICINLAKYFPELYPFDLNNLSREDFIKFTNVMKPFLTPRYHGIDLLEIYINGFSDYLKSVNNTSLKIQGLAGTVNYKLAEKYIISQINSGIPVPFLLLRHENPEFEDFEVYIDSPLAVEATNILHKSDSECFDEEALLNGIGLI